MITPVPMKQTQELPARVSARSEQRRQQQQQDQQMRQQQEEWRHEPVGQGVEQQG